MTINEKRQLTNYIKGLVRESVNIANPYAEFGGGMPKILKISEDRYPEGVIAINPEVGKNDPNRKVFIPADAIKTWKEEYVAISQKDFDKYCMGEEEEDIPDSEDDFWAEMGHEQPGRHYEGPDVTTTDYDTFGSPEYSEKDKPAGINELRQLTESMARQAIANIISEGKKNGKRKNKKEKSSSRDKTVVSKLNADGTNAAHYYYKLYGVENGTEAEKAAARSKGYKKAKGKKNDTGVPYKFSSKEKNRLSSLLTDS